MIVYSATKARFQRDAAMENCMTKRSKALLGLIGAALTLPCVWPALALSLGSDVKFSSATTASPERSADWILSRLLSDKYESKQEGFAAFWSLREGEKDKVVLSLYQHLDDKDGEVRRSAREALKTAGGSTKVLLPKLMERFRKNKTDLDLISSLGPYAAPAVPELLKELKKTGSHELADVLSLIVANKHHAYLADYYIVHTRAELQKLEVASIDTRVPGSLPDGCMIRELLPSNIREATSKTIWDGISFSVADYPLKTSNEISFNLGQAGRLLKNIVSIEKGNYLILSGCRLESPLIAEVIRGKLGMDARPAAVRGGCLEREEFPEYIQALVPEREGNTGIMLAWAVSGGDCYESKGCRLYPKPEFEQMFGILVPYYASSVLCSMQPCRSERDEQASLRKTRQETMATSVYMADPEFKKFLKGMAGNWCGKVVNRLGHENTTMHLKFNESDGVMAGYVAEVFPPNSDGTHPYTPYMQLMPISMSGARGARQVLFTEISKYNFNGSPWYATEEGTSFRIKGPVSDDHVYVVSRNCKGFWTGPGSDK